jgi:hypothetical protein
MADYWAIGGGDADTWLLTRSDAKAAAPMSGTLRWCMDEAQGWELARQ